jgi:putative SOS response-associated peptidase YedK
MLARMCNRYVAPARSVAEQHWQLTAGAEAQRWAPEIFPRALGPFIRAEEGTRRLIVGQWGLVPHFADSPKLRYQTNNARSEEVSRKASYRFAWARGQRCVIPAWSFDEPCWETGRNVWWRFRRADATPWGLAGLWNTWIDRHTGEVVESYTMLTINADAHPLMRRMHKPDPKLGPDQQDKRSVVAVELADVDQWLLGDLHDASALLRAPAAERCDAGPASDTSGTLHLMPLDRAP